MNVAAYIAQRSRALGLDPKAVLAIARQEGLSGRVGDHGTSFGPFQLHLGGAMPRGISNPQQWAESKAGINYALSRINSVAHGLHGAQAIANISRRFERPADPAAEIAGALRDYGKGAGGSPALAVSQMLTGGGGGHAAGGMNLNQLLGSYMIQQANAQLSGQPNSVAEEGQGILQMAMARKALQAASAAGGGAPAAHHGESAPGLASFSGTHSGNYTNLIAGPGVNIAKVDPKLLSVMNAVAKAHGVKITINSGYRSPAHSVAVGGFANDPHTRGIAVDAYVNGQPIGAVFGPALWRRYGITSGDVPNFYNGKPDPEHLQIG